MDFLADLRFSLRALAKNRGFTAVAIATLAVGIGVNAAVFTVTNAVLFRGFPHVDPNNRIVYISRAGCCEISYPDFMDWRNEAKSFTGMAAVLNGGLRLILNDQNDAQETSDGTELTANSFQVLRRQPILGRDFTPADAVPGAPEVAILNYRFWARRYDKNRSIIGEIIRLNNRPTTVIGVMPAGFDFPHHRVDLWIPLAPTPALLKRENRVFWFAFGRLANNADIRSAQIEMDTIGRRMQAAYPATNRNFLPKLWTFHEFFIGADAGKFYGALWGAVGFVLLIACANLAGLLLTRAIGRAREISIRIALGAGRGRIIRQLLAESVILSSLGGGLGWLIAIACVRTYALYAHPAGSFDRWDFTLDYRVFVYLVVVSIGTGLLFGWAPALRTSRLDINAALKDGGRGATGGRTHKRLSAVLVIAEMALATALLAGAGLMLRSFLKIYTADLGVRAANILTAGLELPSVKSPGPPGEDVSRAISPAQTGFFERMADALRTVPGVESVALANSLPGFHAPRLPYQIADAPPADEPNRPQVSAVVVGPHYFATLGATIIAGRPFSDFDAASARPVAIVNQRFASSLWPGENAVGKRLRIFDGKTPGAWRTVVGIASNIVQNDSSEQSFGPVVYIPFRQSPAAYMTLLARTRVPPRSLESTVRRKIEALHPDLAIGSGLGSIEGPKPLSESLAFNFWSHGVNAALFLIFAAIALLLAAVGLYTVIAHSVSQRTQEIGVRIAIGATPRDIRRLVLQQGMLPLGIGLAIGLAGSFAVNRLLQSQLVATSPADPLTLAGAAVVLICAALLGCLIPARRATRVDPVVALRHD